MPPRPPLPQLPEGFTPRQPGESANAYRNRRTFALYGETPYQRRIRIGQERGLTTAEARGHAPVPASAPGPAPETESQRRRRLSVERTGYTPWQLRTMAVDQWLLANGFTPGSTGWSQTRLRNRYTAIRYIYENASPGSRITPDMIEEGNDLEATGEYDPGYFYLALQQKYLSMREYRETGTSQNGRLLYFRDGAVAPTTIRAWWWYR